MTHNIAQLIVERLFRANFSIKRNLNWRLVRGIADLKVLTKASYVMLLIVPMLAALWPGVRGAVNQYNKMAKSSNAIVKKSKADLDSCYKAVQSKILELKSLPVANNQFAQTVLTRAEQRNKEIEQMIIDHNDDFLQKTVEHPKFPRIFAMAFFAALFIGLGHLFYEVGAPEEVKNRNFEEFISYRKQDYDEHPTAGPLDRAKYYMGTRFGREFIESENTLSQFPMRQVERVLERGIDAHKVLSSLSTNELQSFKDAFETRPELRSDFPLLLDAVERFEGPSSYSSDSENGFRLKDLSLIEQGAKVEYLTLASKNVLFIGLVIAFYMLGIILITMVVTRQSQNILHAAGLQSVFDVFDFSAR